MSDSKLKLVAFYLPQFHRIPENDEWWGKGFTDWVSVKKARPLFPGHYQPRVPICENYYNLLDKKVVMRQAKQAKNAGIYGFCIYHYWFGDKLLLEKPAENLLGWKDIDINFCFSWANESWIASWSKLVEGNVWNDSVKRNIKQGDYLIKQKYGDKCEWERHFKYLLPFFSDKRYIKKDNRPVFIIYKPNDIKNLKDMMKIWNKLAIDNGFCGIFFVATNDKKWRRKGMDGMLMYEPSYTFCYEEEKIFDKGFWFLRGRDFFANVGLEFPKLAKYHTIWKKILKRKSKKNVFPGIFVDFDSSPRKGKKGTIFIGASPLNFKKYLQRFIKKYADKEFVFITAWNEWGEGAYIEPDKKYGDRYLKIIKECLIESDKK